MCVSYTIMLMFIPCSFPKQYLYNITFYSAIILVLLLFPLFSQAKTVQIFRTDNNPWASVIEIPAGTKIQNIEICATPEELKRKDYYPNGLQSFIAKQDKVGACNYGLLKKSTLEEEIVDVSNVIAEIKKRIAVLENTIASLTKRQENGNDLTNFKVYAIPSGIFDNKSYDMTSNYKMQCMVSTMSGRLEIVTLGNHSPDRILTYNLMSDKQLKILLALADTNRETYEWLQNKIAKLEPEEKLGKLAGIQFGMKIKSMGKIGADNTFAILPEDISKFSDLDKLKPAEVNNTLAVSYILDKNNKKQYVEDIPEWIAKWFDIKDMAMVNFSIGDITYKDAKLPESRLLVDMKESTEKHLKDLKEKRVEFNDILTKLKTKLNSLKKVNYNCGE